MKKERVIRIIKVTISVLLMYLLIRRIDYAEFRRALANTNVGGVFVVIIAYLLSIVMNAAKWKVLLNETELPFLVGLSFRAQLYSTVLPGQLFGEASKVTAWSKRSEDVATVTASVIFDKITGIIGQILLGAVGIYASKMSSEISNKWILLVFVSGGILFLYVCSEQWAYTAVRKGISHMGKISENAEGKLIKFYDAWCLFSKKRFILLKSVLWGIVYQLTGIFSVWYLSTRMGLGVSIVEYCWIMPLISVILLLPVSFAGIGLRDASLASMLSLFGVSSSNSIVISTVMLLAQIVSAGIGGLFVLRANLLQEDKKE